MTEAGSGVTTRWAVLHEYTVSDDDLDPHGRVSDDAVERWSFAARSAYLGRCRILQRIRERIGLKLQVRAVSKPSGSALGRPKAVLVTASAPEVRPRSFVISVRIRPIGGGNLIQVHARWLIQLLGQDTGLVYE